MQFKNKYIYHKKEKTISFLINACSIPTHLTIDKIRQGLFGIIG